MPALEPGIRMKNKNGVDGGIIKQVLYANSAASMKHENVLNIFLREPFFKKIDGFFPDFNANNQAGRVLLGILYNKNFLSKTNFKIDAGEGLGVDILIEFLKTLTAT